MWNTEHHKKVKIAAIINNKIEYLVTQKVCQVKSE
jgi:hypothetical protein